MDSNLKINKGFIPPGWEKGNEYKMMVWLTSLPKPVNLIEALKNGIKYREKLWHEKQQKK